MYVIIINNQQSFCKQIQIQTIIYNFYHIYRLLFIFLIIQIHSKLFRILHHFWTHFDSNLQYFFSHIHFNILACFSQIYTIFSNFTSGAFLADLTVMQVIEKIQKTVLSNFSWFVEGRKYSLSKSFYIISNYDLNVVKWHATSYG